MRQADNNVIIEGILSQSDLKYGSFTANDGRTIENVGGTIHVLVEQTVNGVPQTLEIPVTLYSSKYTREGKVNPSYTSIETVMNNFTSIAAAGGKEGADKIRISGKANRNGQVRMNEYYSKDGRLVSFPRVVASFVNRAVGDFKPQATFTLDFAVGGMRYATDADGVELEPKKLEVTAIVPVYGDKVEVLTLTATNPNVISSIEQYWQKDYTYRANGRVNFTSSTEKITESLGFGEAVERMRTVSVNELIITGGSEVPLADELAFDVEDLITAMKARKAHLDEMKEKGAMTKRAPAKASLSSEDLGF